MPLDLDRSFATRAAGYAALLAVAFCARIAHADPPTASGTPAGAADAPIAAPQTTVTSPPAATPAVEPSLAAPPAPHALAPPASPTFDDAPARRYARRSVSALGGLGISTGFFGTPSNGSAVIGGVLTSSFAVRIVRFGGLAIEPRVSLDGAGGGGRAGYYAAFMGRAGVGIGWARTITRTIAIAPMLSYEIGYIDGGINIAVRGVAHFVSAELPVTVFVGRSAFVELYLRAGVMAAEQVAPTLSAGYRFGVVL